MWSGLTLVLVQKRQLDFLVPTKRTEMVANRYISLSQIYLICFAPDPAGEAHTSAQLDLLLTKFCGHFLMKREGKNKKKEGRNGG